MIRSFKCKETEKIWNQIFSKKFPVNIQKIALRKLFMIQRAKELKDLKIVCSKLDEIYKLINNLQGELTRLT